MNLPIDPASLILATTTIVATILYIYERSLREKAARQSEEELEGYKQKAFEILHQSLDKSREMLGEAEIESVKVVSDTKFYTKKAEEAYDQQLKKVISQSEQAILEAQKQLLAFIQKIEQKSESLEQFSKEEAKNSIGQIFARLEERVSSFLVSTEQKTLSSIDLEIKAARELIENYKNAQIKLIDENIIAMMEQTLNLVLGKKLSLKEQIDLVYEALEKAKVDKFII